jgi:hypothetical protein
VEAALVATTRRRLNFDAGGSEKVAGEAKKEFTAGRRKAPPDDRLRRVVQ